MSRFSLFDDPKALIQTGNPSILCRSDERSLRQRPLQARFGPAEYVQALDRQVSDRNFLSMLA